MRYLIKKLLWITLIILLVQYINPEKYFINLKSQKQVKDLKKHRNAVSNISFVLQQKKWITFPIPSYIDQMRFLVTANLYPKEMDKSEEMVDIYYNVEYQFLGSDNKILETKTADFNVAFCPLINEKGKVVHSSFYADVPYIPMRSKIIFATLKNNSQKATKIRIRQGAITKIDTRIADIVVTAPAKAADLASGLTLKNCPSRVA